MSEPMTVGELRRFLNTLPLDSNGWPVVALEIGSAGLSVVCMVRAYSDDDNGSALAFATSIVDHWTEGEDKE